MDSTEKAICQADETRSPEYPMALAILVVAYAYGIAAAFAYVSYIGH